MGAFICRKLAEHMPCFLTPPTCEKGACFVHVMLVANILNGLGFCYLECLHFWLTIKWRTISIAFTVLATWPESELRVALTAPPSLPISASQRLWVSTEGPPTSRTALNGDSYEADATPTKAAEEVPGAKRARRHISPVPRTDARVGGPGSGGGEHETENAANTMEKNRHPHLLDTFCVASFTLPTCKGKIVIVLFSWIIFHFCISSSKEFLL